MCSKSGGTLNQLNLRVATSDAMGITRGGHMPMDMDMHMGMHMRM